MRIIPISTLGKWSVRLTVAFLIAYIIALIASLLNISIGVLGTVYGIAIGVAGTLSLIFGLISIFKSKEYSVLVFLSLIVGLYAALFLGFLIWLTFFGGSLFNLNLGGF